MSATGGKNRHECNLECVRKISVPTSRWTGQSWKIWFCSPAATIEHLMLFRRDRSRLIDGDGLFFIIKQFSNEMEQMGKGMLEFFCARTPAASAARVHARVRTFTCRKTHLNMKKNQACGMHTSTFSPPAWGKDVDLILSCASRDLWHCL